MLFEEALFIAGIVVGAWNAPRLVIGSFLM